MAIRKIGENLSFSPDTNLMTPKEALADEQIAKRFVKLAKKLKRIAPRASDFLYGHAIMMHAAEACLIDQDTGEPVLASNGKPAKGSFVPIKVKGNEHSVKWESPDGLKPYKNANGDIFPEDELLKAYKNWVGKPLCKDHKSDSVDGIRGIIIDTYYDPKFKRVHALFALDRKNYPDLARKVETGYANCVSMGTAVGRSVCTECGHVARTERDYCHHVRGRTNYGEVNLDLSPIELSLVVNGADGLAKIRQIVASLQNYAEQKQERIDELLVGACVNPTELQALADNINEMQTKLNTLMKLEQKTKRVEAKSSPIHGLENMDMGELVAALKAVTNPALKEKIEEVLAAKFGIGNTETDEAPPALPATGGGSEPSVSPMAGNGEGTYRTTTTPISVEPSQRLASLEGDGNLGVLFNEIRLLRSKIEKLSKSFNELKTVSKEDDNMNSARLRARAKARRAYWLGGGGINEPTPGKPKYEKEEADKIRDTEDKQMVGEPLETGSEGLHPGDEGRTWETRNLGGGKADKKKAEIEERKLRRQALLEQVQKTDKDAAEDGKLTEAQLQERRLRRRAYWLGGGGINEPTPGKEKYPKEEADKIRDNEDKHLQGIYDMGGTDGMVPGDEKVKKMWLRARLRAKFTKVADDQGNLVKDASRWDVYAGDKLILTATGKEIFDDQLDENWDYLSSKDYGKDIIRHIRTEGFDEVSYLLKGAQDPLAPGGADPLAGGAPAPGGDAPAPEAAPAAPEGEAPAPEKKEDEPDLKGKVEAGLTKIETALDDIRKAVDEGGEKLVDIEVKVDEEGEGGSESPMEQTLAFRDEAMEVHSLLDESADELALVSEALDKAEDLDGETKGRVLSAAVQALADSETLLAQAEVVLAKKKKDDDEDEDDKEDKKKKDKKKEAAKKKDDDKEDEKADKKDKDEDDKEDKKKKEAAKKKKKDEDEDDEDEKEDKKSEKSDAEKKAAELLEQALRVRAQNRAALLAKAMGDMDMMGMGDEMDYALTDADEASLMKLLQEEKQEKGPEGELTHPDLAKDKESDEDEEDEYEKDEKKKKKDEDDADAPMCAEDHAHDESCGGAMMADDGDFAVDEALDSVMAARKAERDALLAQAGDILGKYELDLGKAENATQKEYFEAHPGGKGTTTELTHTKTDGAHVETISEIHDVMRDVAESGPRNVREAAALIQEAIVKGALKAEDVDRLVAEGKVDSAAASYWKKFWAQGPDTGSFGADLSKEFASKKKEADNGEYKTKLRRAYAVGLQAQEKGLIASTQASLEGYVDQLMNFDDAAFESNKRVVANYNSRKGGSLPRVGADGAGQSMTVTASPEPVNAPSLNEQLAQLNWR